MTYLLGAAGALMGVMDQALASTQKHPVPPLTRDYFNYSKQLRKLTVYCFFGIKIN